MVKRGFLRLENINLTVRALDWAMDEGARLQFTCAKIREFPIKLWQYHDFEWLTRPCGLLLDVDEATTRHINYRYARVCIGAGDTRKIPPFTWIKYCAPDGEWSRYDVFFEVEKRFPKGIQGGKLTGSDPKNRV